MYTNNFNQFPIKHHHNTMSHGVNFHGNSLPTVNYSNSISEEFPNNNRSYKIESGISNRYIRDHLPINANVTNATVSDNYIEFVLNSNQQEFFDLNSFTLELKIKINNPNGEDLGKDTKLTVIDGLGHRILSKCTLFLNGTPCESNSYFGLFNTIKSYLNMDKEVLSSIGRNMYYKDIKTTIHDNISNDSFTNLTKDEENIQQECMDIIHLMIPLTLDLSSSNFYLMNGVDIRLRFDLSPPNIVINSSDTITNFNYSIQTVKLWTQQIVPNPDALFSLNKNLLTNNSNIEYIFERPIIKNFVFPSGHSILSLDNIFNGVIPHKLYVFFIRQTAVNGSYKYNASYLTHCNISSLQLQINGNNITSLNGSFPKHIANIFHHTMMNLKNDKNLLSLENFKNGRTIFTWDLRNSDCDDVLPIERSGNLRLTIQTSIPIKDNVIAYVVGMTTGLIEIDAAKRVKTSYLM